MDDVPYIWEGGAPALDRQKKNEKKKCEDLGSLVKSDLSHGRLDSDIPESLYCTIEVMTLFARVHGWHSLETLQQAGRRWGKGYGMKEPRILNLGSINNR